MMAKPWSKYHKNLMMVMLLKRRHRYFKIYRRGPQPRATQNALREDLTSSSVMVRKSGTQLMGAPNVFEQ